MKPNSLFQGVSTQQPIGLYAKFNSFIDRDPLQTKRTDLSKLRESLFEGEERLSRVEKELEVMRREVQEELGLFQAQKERDEQLFWEVLSLKMSDYYRMVGDLWSSSLN